MQEILQKHLTGWTIELQYYQERLKNNPRDFEAIAMIGVAEHHILIVKTFKKLEEAA
jgi:hypothetical protein